MPLFDFKEMVSDAYKNVLNWHMALALLTFGFMGLGRGLDEGGVSGLITQISFVQEFHLNAGSELEQADRRSNITSMVQIGSVAGTILAFFVHDHIGRVKSLQLLCVLWISGFVICITSFGNYGQLLAGRFIGGMGIGQTAVVGPTYLAEVAPQSIRGAMTSVFAASVYLGTTIAYFANYGAALHISNSDRNQWVAPQSILIIFPGILLITSVFAIESPRWLLKVGRDKEAQENLSRLRNLTQDDSSVQTEILDCKGQLERERESTVGTSKLGPYRELFGIKANLYRLLIAVVPQLLGQFSGASSITVYAPEFFEILGTAGHSEQLFATAIVGVVKFTAGMLAAAFLIDFIGRRRSLYAGLVTQIITTLYIALFLLIAGPDDGTDVVTSTKNAGTGAIAMMYISGIGWVMGMNSFQYLVGPEIFPLRLRSLASSLVMTIHFASQYGSSKALPSMLLDLKSYGTFFFFAAVCLVTLVFVWLFVPETARLSLESMDSVFSRPWYQIGRHGRSTADGQTRAFEEATEKVHSAIQHVEVAKD